MDQEKVDTLSRYSIGAFFFVYPTRVTIMMQATFRFPEPVTDGVPLS